MELGARNSCEPGDQRFKIVLKTVGGGLRTLLRLTGINIMLLYIIIYVA